MKLILTDIDDIKIPNQGDCQIIRLNNTLRPCIGCFGCWFKTPGICVLRDGYEDLGPKFSKCSELILVCRLVYGCVSPLVKTALDRALSYIHPNFVIRKGEMHHKRRYKNVISLSALLYGQELKEAEKDTFRKYLEAVADNYDGHRGNISFYNSLQELKAAAI